MATRLKKNASKLYCLASSDKATAKGIITNANSDLIHCLSDICHNLINKRLALTNSHKAKLRKYAAVVRKVADKKTTLKNKKVLVQRGGFLGALLAPLVGTFLGPLMKAILPK